MNKNRVGQIAPFQSLNCTISIGLSKIKIVQSSNVVVPFSGFDFLATKDQSQKHRKKMLFQNRAERAQNMLRT